MTVAMPLESQAATHVSPKHEEKGILYVGRKNCDWVSLMPQTTVS